MTRRGSRYDIPKTDGEEGYAAHVEIRFERGAAADPAQGGTGAPLQHCEASNDGYCPGGEKQKQRKWAKVAEHIFATILRTDAPGDESPEQPERLEEEVRKTRATR